MTKKNLIKLVTFSAAVLSIPAAFFIFAANAAYASGKTLRDRRERRAISNLMTDKTVYQKSETAAVAPVYVPGNPRCSDINASSEPAFAHISSDWGFKFDPPVSGAFSFTDGTGRSLEGGAVPNASTSLTITVTNGTTVDWSAGRIIQAVIIKGGPGANVYPYDPSFGDTGLVAPDGREISHITFCFPSFVPTAAKVSVSGRVTDDAGNGLPRSTLTIINTHTSETRTIVSSSFGFFRFDDLEVGNIYMITVQNKRYSFETETRTFVLNDAMENLDFKASP